MIEPRINDPKTLEPDKIRQILDRDVRPTVQFSGRTYSPGLLAEVNDLCRTFGDKLEVRFYGHYGDIFDAAVLAHLPDVQWLSLDCLSEICNEDELVNLSSLRKLGFGVYKFARRDFLATLRLEQLTQLVLAETARPAAFDLEALSRCSCLETLFLNGHTKNIGAITHLENLSTLSLSGMPKAQPLSFVNDIESLRTLTLLLGGRSSIEEIAHQTLEDLSVIRVRGLETLGQIGRFERLRRLWVEDQLQLRVLPIVGARRLRELAAHNCKNLERIDGLDTLIDLEQFRASRTNLDLDELLVRPWPKTMRVVALYSGSQKWNAKARIALGKRGYTEFPDRPRPQA